MQSVSKLNAACVARLLARGATSSSGALAAQQSVAVRCLSSAASFASPPPVPPTLPGNEVSLFGPKDQRLPLPGNVGISPSELRPEFSYRAPMDQTNRHLTELDMYKVDLTEDRQRRVYSKLVNETQAPFDPSSTDALLQSGPGVDCRAQECPLLVKADFQELFPHLEILSQPLTVITVARRTEHDSALWNEEMGAEREQLTDNFVAKAKQVVRQLQAAGYWADFIDPASGKPYLNGELSDATLFETDHRYRHLGFTIDDLGCCKVITHHEWGRNAFIGCMFTNAPVDSAEVQSLLVNPGDGSSRSNNKH